MSLFTDLLNNPYARRLYLVTVKPYAFVSGSITAVASGNKFTSAGLFRGLRQGDVLETRGPGTTNKGTVTIVSATPNEIVVSGLTLVDQASHTRRLEGVVTRYYSTDGFTTKPTDTPANVWYDPRVETALEFTRSMYQGAVIGGRSVPGFGAISLVNLDGDMDAYRSWGWAGRRVTVEMGGEDFARADYGVIFDGLTDGVGLDDENFVINVRDLQALLNQELWVPTYRGVGSEEGNVDLAGVTKPLTIGKVRNIQPVSVGIVQGRFNYQFHDGAVRAYDAAFHQVLDQGVPLTRVASNPTAAQYTLDEAKGIIVLGGSEPAMLTMDTYGSTGASSDSVARIMEYIVKERLRLDSSGSSTSVAVGSGTKTFITSDTLPIGVGGKVLISLRDDPDTVWMFGQVTAWSGGTLEVDVTRFSGAGTYEDWTVTKIGLLDSEIVPGTFDALHTLNPAPTGVYLPEGGLAMDVLDELALSIGAYYGFTRSGLFEVGRLEEPTGEAVLTLSGDEVLDLERLDTQPPVWRLQLGYARNWTPLEGTDIAESVRENVVTNGTFNVPDGWTLGTGWTIGSGTANAASGTASDLSRPINLVVGQTYTFRAELTISAGSVQPKIGTTNIGSAVTASSFVEVDFIAAGASTTVVFSKDSTFVGSVENVTITAKRLSFLTNEYRIVSVADSSVRSVYGPGAISERINTLLDVQTDAVTEAERQLTLVGVFRDVFKVEAKTQPFAVDIGDLVELIENRWGLESGRLFRVLEIEEDAADNRVVLTLWG